MQSVLRVVHGFRFLPPCGALLTRPFQRAYFFRTSDFEITILREVARHFGRLPDAASHPLGIEAEKLIEFMIFDLHDKLEPIGRLNLLDEVNGRVQAYYDSFAGNEESPEIVRRRSAWLSKRGDVSLAQGDLAGALLAVLEPFREMAIFVGAR